MAQVKTQLVIDGKNNSKKAFDEVNSQLNSMNKQLATAGKALAGYFTVSTFAGMVRGIANAADSYSMMNARLKLATESQEEFNTAQTELRRIAAATQTPLESLATLYQRISRPLKEAGRSQKDILAVTEAVSTSFRVSGASAQEAENGVIQFAQALGAGALRGDEFNSVADQAPRLMQALADSLNVPIGSLKEMAAQGLLTADVVTSALVSQLDTLRTEAATLPSTVGGAMVKLGDITNQVFGGANAEPLIASIDDLGTALQDQDVAESVQAIASALSEMVYELSTILSDEELLASLATLGEAIAVIGVAAAKTAAVAAKSFTTFGKDLGYIAAVVSGNVTEIDRANKEIEKLEAAQNGFGMLDLYMSDAQIAKSLAEWRAYRAQLLGEVSGIADDMKGVADSANNEAEEARQADLAARSSYISTLKSQQAQMVKAAEAGGKQLVAAEKSANRELQKVRNDRLKIEERYREAIAGMNAGGEASYGDAQALKVGARQALQAGDVEGAQAKAQAALKMLQDLQAAGANTYGFAGFIGELRDIELAANDIEQSRAEQKIADIKQEMINLKSAAAVLEDMPVSVKMDDAALAQVQAALDALAKREIIVKVGAQYDFSQPYTLQDPGPAPQKFATGGYISGPGTGTSDSIPAYLSNGEYVINAAAVRKLGKRHLDMLNRGIPIPRFADGGMVGTVASLDTSPRNLGSLDISIGGDTYQVFADSTQADQLRLAARKHGRTHRS